MARRREQWQCQTTAADGTQLAALHGMVGVLIAGRAARKWFAARPRNDRDARLAPFEIDACLAPFEEDAMFTLPGAPPIGGTGRGLGEIRAWFERSRQQLPDPRFELVAVFVNRLRGAGAREGLTR
ncbi:MAG: nuclear transport factor 2 family protein [Candidatus Rokuibacteriota bacterium]